MKPFRNWVFTGTINKNDTNAEKSVMGRPSNQKNDRQDGPKQVIADYQNFSLLIETAQKIKTRYWRRMSQKSKLDSLNNKLLNCLANPATRRNFEWKGNIILHDC